MPARIVPKNYRNLTGLVYNSRTQSLSMFESTLERDYLLLLDFDPAVEYYEEQPVTIQYSDNAGRHRRYTPDVLVCYHSACVVSSIATPLLGEIKYREDLRQHWAKYKPKFKAARCYAKRRGWRFRLITEREIRTPYLNTIKFLRQYRDIPIDEKQLAQLLEVMARQQETDPARLLASITQDRWRQAELLPGLWKLVGLRQIGADLGQPLTMGSRLWSIAR